MTRAAGATSRDHSRQAGRRRAIPFSARSPAPVTSRRGAGDFKATAPE